jgi:hypothetical protein
VALVLGVQEAWAWIVLGVGGGAGGVGDVMRGIWMKRAGEDMRSGSGRCIRADLCSGFGCWTGGGMGGGSKYSVGASESSTVVDVRADSRC